MRLLRELQGCAMKLDGGERPFVVADDDLSSSERVARIVHRHHSAIAFVRTEPELRELLASVAPFAIAVALTLAGSDVFRALFECQSRHGHVPTLIRSQNPSESDLMNGFRLEAKVVPRSEQVEEEAILRFLHHALAGGAAELDGVPGILGRLAADANLTRKEHEVVRERVCGRTLEEVCGLLNIEKTTYKRHVREILRKVGAVVPCLETIDGVVQYVLRAGRQPARPQLAKSVPRVTRAARRLA